MTADHGTVLLAWAVSRGVPWIAPRPSLPLAVAALGVAVLLGVATEGLAPSLSARSFGAFHVAFGALALFGVAAGVVGMAFIARGNYDGLTRSGDLVPAFFAAERKRIGDYRVLWLTGAERHLRADVSSPDGETILTFHARRAGDGARAIAKMKHAGASVISFEDLGR